VKQLARATIRRPRTGPRGGVESWVGMPGCSADWTWPSKQQKISWRQNLRAGSSVGEEGRRKAGDDNGLTNREAPRQRLREGSSPRVAAKKRHQAHCGSRLCTRAWACVISHRVTHGWFELPCCPWWVCWRKWGRTRADESWGVWSDVPLLWTRCGRDNVDGRGPWQLSATHPSLVLPRPPSSLRPPPSSLFFPSSWSKERGARECVLQYMAKTGQRLGTG
jgi:hypothetical protein